MVKMTAEYTGGLHCTAVHGPSGNRIETDAPVDNQGRGEAFSPTDLAGASLLTCMMTTMELAARRNGMDLTGMRGEVTKEMSSAPPRRIVRLSVQIWIPLPRSADPQGIVEAAGLGCPMQRSLHPDVERPVVFHWKA
jgi:uncharacterized OsmC-like protein